jgi:hypothetical protein
MTTGGDGDDSVRDARCWGQLSLIAQTVRCDACSISCMRNADEPSVMMLVLVYSVFTQLV